MILAYWKDYICVNAFGHSRHSDTMFHDGNTRRDMIDFGCVIIQLTSYIQIVPQTIQNVLSAQLKVLNLVACDEIHMHGTQYHTNSK